MKNISFLIAVFIFLTADIFAQDLRKKAEENPLDCAFYLLTKDESRSETENLAENFFEVGRYDDALRTIEFEEYRKISWLIFHTSKLIEQGNDTQAKAFLDKTMSLLGSEDADIDRDDLVFLAPLLIKYGRNQEASALYNLSEDQYKPRTAIGISKAFFKANQSENALKLLPAAFDIAEIDRKAEIIELFARLKQTDRAKKLLDEFDFAAFLNESFYQNRRFTLFPLINAHLALGQLNRAVELWQQYGENDDAYGWSKFIDALIEFGYREKADFYLTQIESNPALLKKEGYRFVEIHLKFGDTERALKIAETMSDNNDDFWQQDSLVKIADRYITDGRTDKAEEILDFAFERAKKVKYERFAGDSTSPGIRKVGYFRKIFQGFIKIKRFDKALTAINIIESEDSLAREFIVESLSEYVKQQIKTLPRKKIDEILKRIQNLFTDDDDKNDLIKAKLIVADVYAKSGEKSKAVALLTEVLKYAKEESYSEEYILINAGKIFEQNKLKIDANLKKILKEFVEDAE